MLGIVFVLKSSFGLCNVETSNGIVFRVICLRGDVHFKKTYYCTLSDVYHALYMSLGLDETPFNPQADDTLHSTRG
jgi:hypothetical protein